MADPSWNARMDTESFNRYNRACLRNQESIIKRRSKTCSCTSRDAGKDMKENPAKDREKCKCPTYQVTCKSKQKRGEKFSTRHEDIGQRKTPRDKQKKTDSTQLTISVVLASKHTPTHTHNYTPTHNSPVQVIKPNRRILSSPSWRSKRFVINVDACPPVLVAHSNRGRDQ